MSYSDPAWVFVSYSTFDLAEAREIRNFIEAKGAYPLLFQLISLQDPEEFWPLIVREIEERNFFLLLDSANAEKSHWVQREREQVEKVLQDRPVRIGRVRIDDGSDYLKAVNEFLKNLNVYVSFDQRDQAVVAPFLDALDESDFVVSKTNEDLPSSDDEAALRLNAEFMVHAVEEAVNNGWFVRVVTKNSLLSGYHLEEFVIATWYMKQMAEEGFRPGLIDIIAEEIDLDFKQLPEIWQDRISVAAPYLRPDASPAEFTDWHVIDARGAVDEAISTLREILLRAKRMPPPDLFGPETTHTMLRKSQTRKPWRRLR